jgi:hypothetical protein
MVAVTVQHDDECPRCRFRGALEKYLVRAATGTEDEWHEAASSIMTMLTIASSAMATMRARWCDDRPADVMDKGAAIADLGEGQWKQYVCVEPGRVSGDTADEPGALRPGDAYELEQTVRLEMDGGGEEA